MENRESTMRLLWLAWLCSTVVVQRCGAFITRARNGWTGRSDTCTLLSLNVDVKELPTNRIRLHSTASKESEGEKEEDDLDEFDLSLDAFQRAKEQTAAGQREKELEQFDGYAFRDALVAKWGECYDVDFNRVDSFGFRKLYLNILPYRLGRRPWRHESELDYLCHLQAVVEILEKYKQLDYVLYQIQDTKKKPLAGRSPIVAVPIRLDLTPEQVQEILGY